MRKHGNIEGHQLPNMTFIIEDDKCIYVSNPSLIQVVACRQFGTNTLDEPMVTCKLDPWE